MAKPSNIAAPSPALPDNEEVRPPLDSALDDLIGYAMRRAQLKLFQNLIGRLSDHDLRPAQFSALAIIEQNPGLMQADLARALAIEPPQVVPLLNKLESRALAVRVRCKPDKRSYGIFLSKAGEALLIGPGIAHPVEMLGQGQGHQDHRTALSPDPARQDR